jgi:hypothetical protein
VQLLKFELAIYESTFFRVLSDALAKGDYALAKRIVNSAIDVPAGGSRTYAFDLYIASWWRLFPCSALVQCQKRYGIS